MALHSNHSNYQPGDEHEEEEESEQSSEQPIRHVWRITHVTDSRGAACSLCPDRTPIGQYVYVYLPSGDYVCRHCFAAFGEDWCAARMLDRLDQASREAAESKLPAHVRALAQQARERNWDRYQAGVVAQSPERMRAAFPGPVYSKLSQMAERYQKQAPVMRQADGSEATQRRLEFARWLVQTGKLGSDDRQADSVQ